MVESAFNHVHYLKSQKRINLNIECDDLQLKLTNLQLDICDLFNVHQTHFSY